MEQKNGFYSEYIDATATASISDAEEELIDEEKEFTIDEQKYGVSKPHREVIKAFIIQNEKDTYTK